MNPEEQKDLLDELLERLRAEGVPEGAWLVDIAEIRRALQDADALLRRLQDAIMRAARERRQSEP